jgi:anti-sigma B factor antagonist
VTGGPLPDPVADAKQARERIDLSLLEAATALDLMAIPDVVAPDEDKKEVVPYDAGRSLVWATTEVDDLPETDFDIQTEVSDDRAVIALRGEMDVYSAARLRDTLNQVLTQGHVDIVLDLEALDFMDSTALGVMARASRRARDAGGELCLRSPQRSLQRVLEITGMAHVLTVIG